MKRKSIITLLAISMICLSSCGKSDDVEPVVSEAVETADQQEPEEEPEPVVEDIVEEEPEQEVEEVAEVEDNDNVEPEAEEEPDQQEEIEIEALDKTMYAIQSVNVREGDSTTYDVIGHLSFNEAVHVIGRSVGTSWYKLDLGGNDSAFVSNNYLSDNPIEVQQVEQAQQNSGTVDNSSNVGADVGTGLTPEGRAFLESQGITPKTWDGTISEGNPTGTVNWGDITAE